VVIERPYQESISENKIIRIFHPDVDEQELKWHQDLKDRTVKIKKSGNWKFQNEDQLPVDLIEDMEIFIPKYTWHRVIKGDSHMIVEIEEK
jgi:hypothetical protein